MGSRKLNERQRRFVAAYLETANATESYRRAYGSTGSTAEVGGSKLLRNPKVLAEIAQVAAKVQKASIATIEECFELWTSMMRDGRIEPKDRLKASELRAKAAGVFVERREVSGPAGGPIEVSRYGSIPDDELAKLAEQAARVLREGK